MEDVRVEVSVTTFAKCERCWQHLPEVGKIFKWPDLCWRCTDVLDALHQKAIDEETEPKFYDKYLKTFETHPIKALAKNPSVKRLLSKSGKILEIWGTEEQMPWARFKRAA